MSRPKTMTTTPLRWGLLGTARINRALIPAIRAAARSRLVGVASRDLARADAYAREWGIPRTFGSYEAMLADPDIDVSTCRCRIICTLSGRARRRVEANTCSVRSPSRSMRPALIGS